MFGRKPQPDFVFTPNVTDEEVERLVTRRDEEIRGLVDARDRRYRTWSRHYLHAAIKAEERNTLIRRRCDFVILWCLSYLIVALLVGHFLSEPWRYWLLTPGGLVGLCAVVVAWAHIRNPIMQLETKPDGTYGPKYWKP